MIEKFQNLDIVPGRSNLPEEHRAFLTLVQQAQYFLARPDIYDTPDFPYMVEYDPDDPNVLAGKSDPRPQPEIYNALTLEMGLFPMARWATEE